MKGVGLYEMGGCIRKLILRDLTKLRRERERQNSRTVLVSKTSTLHMYQVFHYTSVPQEFKWPAFFCFLKNVNGKGIHFTVAS